MAAIAGSFACRAGLLLLRLPPLLLSRIEVPIRELLRAHADRRKLAQTCRKRAVRDSFRMQLLFDVRRETRLLDARDVAWTGAEADAIQHVRHGPVIRFGRNG